MIYQYDLECSQCGNTFPLQVESTIMEEYLSRINGEKLEFNDKWIENFNKKLIKPIVIKHNIKYRCHRPFNDILKNIDEKLKYQLLYFVCDNCYQKLLQEE